MGNIPVICLFHAGLEIGPCRPPQGAQAAHIHHLARHAVGLGSVEGKTSLPANHLGDGLCEFEDADVMPGSNVQEEGIRVVLHHKHARVRQIVGEK